MNIISQLNQLAFSILHIGDDISRFVRIVSKSIAVIMDSRLNDNFRINGCTLSIHVEVNMDFVISL